jgi:hypothetical protein
MTVGELLERSGKLSVGANPQKLQRWCRSCSLLGDVGQLVPHEADIVPRLGAPQPDPIAGGHGARAEHRIQGVSRIILSNVDIAKVRPELSLERCPHARAHACLGGRWSSLEQAPRYALPSARGPSAVDPAVADPIGFALQWAVWRSDRGSEQPCSPVVSERIEDGAHRASAGATDARETTRSDGPDHRSRSRVRSGGADAECFRSDHAGRLTR